MKKEINDLLLKMQTGENCIGETANKLLDLFAVSGSLRDKFASEAMNAIIIKNGVPSDYHWGNNRKDGKPDLAKKSYEIADAMMKTRSNDR